MKKRYTALVLFAAWCLFFYYTLYIGWETDRSTELNMKPWIGKSFQLNEAAFMYRTEGWYHEVDVPRHDVGLPRDIDEFRARPDQYNRSKISSIYLLDPGTQFKIVKIVDVSTWAITSLDIKAVLLTGPHAGKTVLVTYLFDSDWQRSTIHGPESGILTQLN
jgi:hypothetical protein